MNLRNSRLKFFLLILFALIIAIKAPDGSICQFEPETYNVLSLNDLNLTLNLTVNTAPKSVYFSCATPSATNFIGIPTITNLSASQYVNFSCNFSQIGQYKVSAGMQFDANTQIACTNTATVYVTYLQVGTLHSPQTIIKGQHSEIVAEISNVQSKTPIALIANLTDQTFNNQLVDSKQITLAGGETLPVSFVFDTSALSAGTHLLNVTVYPSIANNLHFASNATSVLIVAYPKLLEIGNGTVGNDSAAIAWRTDLPSNYSLTYTDPAQNQTIISGADPSTSFSISLHSLAPQTTYFYSLVYCSAGYCNITGQFNFTTLSNSSPQASPTVIATASPTVAASATPIAVVSPIVARASPQASSQAGSGSDSGNPSPSPSPIAYPSPSPAAKSDLPEWVPITENDYSKIGEIIEENFTSKIINSTDKQSFNLINVINMEFEPSIVREGVRVKFYGTTDSKYQLLVPNCYVPPSDLKTPKGFAAAKCTCYANETNKFFKFRCEIYPTFKNPLGDRYTLQLSNEKNESGIFIANLPTGKKATLTRFVISSSRNEYYFYIFAFISIMAVGYALYHILQKFERDDKAEEMLVNQKSKILDDMDLLKKHYLKRDLDVDVYNHAMLQKQKELTEVNTRIAEYENKLGRSVRKKEGLKNEAQQKSAAQIRQDIKRKDEAVDSDLVKASENAQYMQKSDIPKTDEGKTPQKQKEAK